jgi:hypothetical protein
MSDLDFISNDWENRKECSVDLNLVNKLNESSSQSLQIRGYCPSKERILNFPDMDFNFMCFD